MVSVTKVSERDKEKRSEEKRSKIRFDSKLGPFEWQIGNFGGQIGLEREPVGFGGAECWLLAAGCIWPPSSSGVSFGRPVFYAFVSVGMSTVASPRVCEDPEFSRILLRSEPRLERLAHSGIREAHLCGSETHKTLA